MAMKTKRVIEYLQYHFSSPELLDISKELARTSQEKRALESRKAEVTKKLAGEITEKDGVIQKLTDLVSQGYDYRDIECELRFDMPYAGMVSVVRLDTGEVVKERSQTYEERQMWLGDEETNTAVLVDAAADTPDEDVDDEAETEDDAAGVPRDPLGFSKGRRR